MGIGSGQKSTHRLQLSVTGRVCNEIFRPVGAVASGGGDPLHVTRRPAGQSAHRAGTMTVRGLILLARASAGDAAADTIITNALIVYASGTFKADLDNVGLRPSGSRRVLRLRQHEARAGNKRGLRSGPNPGQRQVFQLTYIGKVNASHKNQTRGQDTGSRQKDDTKMPLSRMTDWCALVIGGALLTGCLPSETGDAHGTAVEMALDSTNGLVEINGLSGNGLSGNGLSGNGLSGNGLSGNGLSGNGLSGNGLVMNALNASGLTASTYLMNSASGRSTVSYLVRCALAATRSITKQDLTGASYTFPGEIGVAPEWEAGTCGSDCQQQVSACMLAHVNTSGQHIMLWLDGDSPAIGWGQDSGYPYQEGSFFGNIFTSPPTAFYCNGKDFDQGVVPGRLGAGQPGAPYTDPLTTPGGYCKDTCTPADNPHNGDGYKACNGYNHIVTVWRNFDPNTNYKICSRLTGKCLDIAGASLDNVAELIQNTYTSSNSQKWKVLQVSPGKYKVINVNSGKGLDVGNGSTSDGAWVQQYTYYGNANQLWSFTPSGTGYYKFSPGSNANGSLNVKGGSSADGTPIEQRTWSATSTSEQWNIIPAN